MSLGRLIPRKKVIEQFSQFLDVEENRSPDAAIPWKTIPSLESDMRHHMKSHPATESSCLLECWHRACSSNSPFPKYELAAFLEESCYWAARKIYKLPHPRKESIVDYFQYARHAALTSRTFSKYKDSQGMQLKTYLQDQIEKLLLKVIFQGQEAAASYSDWGLLLNTSKKFTLKALIEAGIEEQQRNHCMLARQCFQDTYAPQRERGRLQEPTSEELADIAEHYNQLRSSQEPAVNSDNIIAMLNIIISAARASTAKPRFISRDDPNYLEEDIEHINNNENLRSPAYDISQEQAPQEEMPQQINVFLANATEALPRLGQTILQLSHGLGLKQKDIGRAISLDQSGVSRQLRNYERLLLKALAEWSQTQMGINLDAEELDGLKAALKQWLDQYYSSFFHAYLQEVLINELRDEIPLLRRYYGQGLFPMEVGSELNLSETAVNQRLEQTKQHLQTRLHSWVQNTYDLCHNALDLTGKLIADLVEKWLIKLKYELGNLGESR